MENINQSELLTFYRLHNLQNKYLSSVRHILEINIIKTTVIQEIKTYFYVCRSNKTSK